MEAVTFISVVVALVFLCCIDLRFAKLRIARINQEKELSERRTVALEKIAKNFK